MPIGTTYHCDVCGLDVSDEALAADLTAVRLLVQVEATRRAQPVQSGDETIQPAGNEDVHAEKVFCSKEHLSEAAATAEFFPAA